MVKVSICLPVYNSESMIEEALASCTMQDYPNKEILVVDDHSQDRTVAVASKFKGVRVLKNKTNLGFAKNLQVCVDRAEGDIIVFLCGDDMFIHPAVISDIVMAFNSNPEIGMVDRNYIQYMDGYDGPVVAVRECHPLISCVNPSGIGFRKKWIGKFSDKIYVEVPFMALNMLREHGWAKLPYDTIAVRIHKKNQALNPDYYRGSILQNWYDLIGPSKILWDFKGNYITIKNRTGQKNLYCEIRNNIRLEPRILLHPGFYFFALLAIITPRKILIELSDFYRHRIGRLLTRQRYRHACP